ncbi:hypothetical protein ACIGGE_17735 [Qipengyuania sp. NPDC077410]|uniref:hypothetical protein n=1 Tax=Qipengyuania sp. NPDC077410 TaxID=3364496 RepID=UPI0037C86D7D
MSFRAKLYQAESVLELICEHYKVFVSGCASLLFLYCSSGQNSGRGDLNVID